MTNAETNNPLDDELLSAYVDGQLSDEERQAVERRLEHDADARQLLAELRVLSTTLRGLPDEEIGADLRDGVFQQAEREMLLGSGAQPATDLDLAKPNLSVPRRWIWTATAVAAALLLTLFLPSTEPEDRPVAKAKRQLKTDAERLKQPTAAQAPEFRALQDESGAREEVSAQEAAEVPAEMSVVEESGESTDSVQRDIGVAPSAPQSGRKSRTRSNRLLPVAPKGEAIEEEQVVGRARDDRSLARVHLTLKDSEAGKAEFLDLLAENKITWIQKRDRSAYRRGQLSQSPSQAIGGGLGREMLSSKEIAVNGPLVVEASPAQFQRLLAALHDDTRHFKSLWIAGGKTANFPQQWMSWQRKFSGDSEEVVDRLNQPADRSSATPRVEHPDEERFKDRIKADLEFSKTKSLRLVFVLQTEEPAPAAAATPQK